jgi:hypothetical protein
MKHLPSTALGAIIAGAAMALATGVMAQTAPSGPQSSAHPSSVAAPAVKPGDETGSKLSRALFARPEAWARSPGDAQLPTAVDRRFASDRVVGSVGYLCGLDSHAFGDPGSRGPASGFDREDTFLGAKLSYAFK